MKRVKSFALLAVTVLTFSALTSCNRGYGCPSNFSVNETAVKVVQQSVQIVLGK